MVLKAWIRKLAGEVLEERMFDVRTLAREVQRTIEMTTDLQRTVDREIQRFKALNDDIDERLERGTKAWRNAEAARRRAEVAREEEEWDDEFQGGDARGSDQEELFPVHGSMEPDAGAEPLHIRVAKEMARGIITS